MSTLQILESPHIIKVYEESVSGLTRRQVALLVVYTHDPVNTPPEHRCQLRIEVSKCG